MPSFDSFQSTLYNDPYSASSKYLLGDLLLKDKKISSEQLQQAVSYQQQHREMALGDILVHQHSISRRQLSSCLKRQKSLRAAIFSIAFCILPPQLAAAKDFQQEAVGGWEQSSYIQFQSMAVAADVVEQLISSQQVVYSISGPLQFFPANGGQEKILDGRRQQSQQFKSNTQYRFDVLKDGVSFSIRYEF